MARKEILIQNEIRDFLRAYGWKVERMHGNAFQKGIADLYAVHPTHGKRWIEVKPPTGYSFTNAQLLNFPDFELYNDPIWILNAGTIEEYKKLFEPPNWRSYLKPRHLKKMKTLCKTAR